MEFKEFLIESDQNDVQKTLKKLPAQYSKLLKGFKFNFQDGNTLKGDDGHVGLIDTDKRAVTIAAPYFYGREWVILHELAHIVWRLKIDEKKKKEWSKIVKNTKNKMKDNDEELFCFAFCNVYAKHQIKIHDHPEWVKFIKSLL